MDCKRELFIIKQNSILHFYNLAPRRVLVIDKWRRFAPLTSTHLSKKYIDTKGCKFCANPLAKSSHPPFLYVTI